MKPEDPTSKPYTHVKKEVEQASFNSAILTLERINNLFVELNHFARTNVFDGWYFTLERIDQEISPWITKPEELETLRKKVILMLGRYNIAQEKSDICKKHNNKTIPIEKKLISELRYALCNYERKLRELFHNTRMDMARQSSVRSKFLGGDE